MRWIAGIIGLVLVPLCAPAAAAQSAYFKGYAAPVGLPGGDSGLVRKLHDGGAANAETVRIVVTDKRGEVRALGPKGYAAEFSCTGSRCSAYVYDKTALLPDVYRFDAPSTRSADVLSAATGADLDLVMLARSGYGFVPESGVFARLFGALSCLAQWWPSFIVLIVIGACAVPAWCRLQSGLASIRGRRKDVDTAMVVQAIAIIAAVAGLCALYLWGSAYPPLLALIVVGLPSLALPLRCCFRDTGEGPVTPAAA